MSRAMNIALPEQEVLQRCKSANIKISAIETLVSGGTHLVVTTSEDVPSAHAEFKRSLIEGRVVRAHTLWAKHS